VEVGQFFDVFKPGGTALNLIFNVPACNVFLRAGTFLRLLAIGSEVVLIFGLFLLLNINNAKRENGG